MSAGLPVGRWRSAVVEAYEGRRPIEDLEVRGAVEGAVAALDSGDLRVAAPDSDGVELADVKVAVLGLGGFLEPYFWRKVAGSASLMAGGRRSALTAVAIVDYIHV